jgi:hypothetical protein
MVKKKHANTGDKYNVLWTAVQTYTASPKSSNVRTTFEKMLLGGEFSAPLKVDLHSLLTGRG